MRRVLDSWTQLRLCSLFFLTGFFVVFFRLLFIYFRVCFYGLYLAFELLYLVLVCSKCEFSLQVYCTLHFCITFREPDDDEKFLKLAPRRLPVCRRPHARHPHNDKLNSTSSFKCTIASALSA